MLANLFFVLLCGSLAAEMHCCGSLEMLCVENRNDEQLEAAIEQGLCEVIILLLFVHIAMFFVKAAKLIACILKRL